MSQKISQAELSVMEVLWAHSPLAASDIADGLAGAKKWNIKTIKTLLSRLVDKGALSTTKDGRRYLYSPEISRADYSRTAARKLSDRLFGGRATPLVAHLAEGQGLSDEDIADLEALLAELKNDR
ncbi:MAG: BlaI/MecI/CopY family transcriptional regulator [Acidimicrobiales bacterium]|nr:BlaI/MecI/CopY family transcriptional regulator [Hyphomonadaceae bacterium]RZV42649.1 MAG: BlaI/MecI/CopY family transcriptional regulator [Acidimicrobiales bacterium]